MDKTDLSWLKREERAVGWRNNSARGISRGSGLRQRRRRRKKRGRTASVSVSTKPGPGLRKSVRTHRPGGQLKGHGSLGAGGGVVQPRKGEGVDWLGDEGGRAEALGWAERNQLEKGVCGESCAAPSSAGQTQLQKWRIDAGCM